MANVILVEPSPLKPPIKFTYRSYAPLALLTIAAPLLEAGYSVKIIDQRINGEWKQELLDSIVDETLCVGITSMTGRQLLYALEASVTVKENTDVPVVWGGIHASLLPDQTLKDKNIDFVVQGEGEMTFLELIRVLKNKSGQFDGIDGLWYKENGSIKKNSPRDFLDINTLPRIPFELVDLIKYDLDDAIPIFTSRGCAHRCGFCYNLKYSNRRWRGMSPERVIDDLKYYISKYKPNKIIFRDDNFFQDLKRSRKICESMINEGIKVRWRGSCRIDYIKRMSERDFQIIRDSGFEDFGFGLESGSDKILKIMKKDITPEDINNGTKILQQRGMLYGGSFVCGYPGETEEDFDETMDFITNLFTTDPSFTFVMFLYVPYPGNEAYESLINLYGFKFPERIEDWAIFHFAHDTAVTAVGKANSFYSYKTPWMTDSHKEKVYKADLLCQVAGRPLFRASSIAEKILSFPYNLLIHIARFRWRYKLLGPVPEEPIINLIRSVGMKAYKLIKGDLPKR